MGIDAEARLRGALDDGLQRASDLPTSALVRIALRVSILRQDPLGEFWLWIELDGVTKARGAKGGDALARLVALVGSERAEELREREFAALLARRAVPTDDNPDAVLPVGVAELEADLKTLEELCDDQVTPGMTPIDTGLASLDRNKLRAGVLPVVQRDREILARIREAAYGYLVEAESELLRGETIPDAMSQGRAFVDGELALRATDARDALAAAEERLANGGDEAMSHSATSCRRAIKALADALYPPSEPIIDDEGARRILDDEHYRNRLIEYVRQRRGRSKHAELLAANLAVLGTRLKSLDDLASKGVHTRVSRDEAQTCISWTYMLAADLLRIEAQTS